jgi:hypothetical protein
MKETIKKCHLCDSENVKIYGDFHYGFRNGIYVGAYQETYYACEVHKPNKKEKAENPLKSRQNH